VLPRFLAALAPVASPVLLNLGPVIGQNISFFGDRLSCKIFVEDLFPDIEARARPGARGPLIAAFDERLRHEPGSIDGILCWEVFDFLDRPTGQALAARLVRMLKPGGVLYGFFGASKAEIDHYTRFIVETSTSFRVRTVPAPRGKRNVLVTRDINKMFEGLVVAESVLLKSSTRETMFRKP
jgi:Methyltransferase domain